MSLGGKIESREEVYEYIDPITKEKKSVKSEVWKLKKSSIGKVLAVVEDNGLNMEDLDKGTTNSNVIELITEPLHFHQVKKFQTGLDSLKAIGALGTNSQTPVSIQINVEMLDEKSDRVSSEVILNLMRNYYRPENFSTIQREVPLIAGRESYVGTYSDGFMEKLFDPSYRPDNRELYDDYFYRQSAEYLGYTAAWSDSLGRVQSFVREELPKQGFESILKA